MPPLITHPSVACRLVSRAAFLEQAASLGTRYDKLVVGVAIIHPFLSTTEPLRVLIVQRAAHEKFLPGVYELPGGHVEESDLSILDGAAREVLEETGLVVEEIVGEISPFEYSVEKMLAAGGSTGTTTATKTTIQLNFVVRVAPAVSAHVVEVTLNPQEHQDYAWISRNDLERYNITEQMKGVITDAFSWAEKNISAFQITAIE